MQLQPGKKVYFASDQHFGAPTPELSFPREQKFVNWLNEIKNDAQVLFLLGDLFDFWFDELEDEIAKLNDALMGTHMYR